MGDAPSRRHAYGMDLTSTVLAHAAAGQIARTTARRARRFRIR
jgi:hypothetical protein